MRIGILIPNESDRARTCAALTAADSRIECVTIEAPPDPQKAAWMTQQAKVPYLLVDERFCSHEASTYIALWASETGIETVMLGTGLAEWSEKSFIAQTGHEEAKRILVLLTDETRTRRIEEKKRKLWELMNTLDALIKESYTDLSKFQMRLEQAKIRHHSACAADCPTPTPNLATTR